MELQKPVDRRFKSDHPHALIPVAVALFLLVFPVVPWAGAASGGNQTSEVIPPATTATSTNTSTNTTQVSSCLSKTGQFMVSPRTRVAVVEPIFTATPYSQYIYGSFYAFYKNHAKAVGNITTDLKLLNTSVLSGTHFNFGWGHSYPLYQFLTSKGAQNCGLVLGKNLRVVNDINVSQGALFARNGSANFVVVVYGFAEYVSQPEYSQLVKFVASGGRLVIMGGDSFQVRVDYNPRNGYETYVLGHGFAYNNKTAWRTVPLRLGFNLTRFIGATDCCFRLGTFSGAKVNQSNVIGAGLSSVFGDTVFKSYAPHEEDSVQNFSHTSVIAMFRNSSGTLVASFVHQYRKGVVICMCVFADDVISTDQSVQYFAMLAIGTPASDLISGAHVSQLGPNVLLEVSVSAAVVAAVFIVFFLAGRRRTTAVASS